MRLCPKTRLHPNGATQAREQLDELQLDEQRQKTAGARASMASLVKAEQAEAQLLAERGRIAELQAAAAAREGELRAQLRQALGELERERAHADAALDAHTSAESALREALDKAQSELDAEREQANVAVALSTSAEGKLAARLERTEASTVVACMWAGPCLAFYTA